MTEQFLDFLEVLNEIDINAVGDFLEMASTLIEIKSRLILPHGDEQTEELEDPRDDLVQRLLEYKKYKDAASILDEQSRAGSNISRDSRTTCPLPRSGRSADSRSRTVGPGQGFRMYPARKPGHAAHQHQRRRRRSTSIWNEFTNC